MLSPIAVKVIKIMPEGLLISFGKIMVNNFIKKYAKLHVENFESIESVEGPKIFICNHLSNSDGVVLNKLLKEKYNPYFIAGVKLSDDPVTKMGTKIVKHIAIKPNTADKEAITNMVKVVRAGENLVIFPEGTRSRTGAMIEAKKGILLVARLTKASIIPIGMSGTSELLPISEEGNMGAETWHKADVYIKVGSPVVIPKREKDEDKHLYDERCMNTIMGSIANQLPEKLRGVYK